MNLPAAEKPAPKASVGQKEDTTDGGTGLAQFAMGGMGGGGQPSGPGIQVVIPENELLSLIMDLIEPDSWKNRDDVYAKAVPGSLIIRHTDAVHRQIGQLLGRLNVLRTGPGGGFTGGMGGMGGGFF